MFDWTLMTQVGRIMRRAANSLPHERDWPLLSLQVLAVPTVFRAFQAAEIVTELKARHRPVSIPDRWNVGVTDIDVCNACRQSWPCDDITIITKGERAHDTEGQDAAQETAALGAAPGDPGIRLLARRSPADRGAGDPRLV